MQSEAVGKKVDEIIRWAADLTGEQKYWDDDPSYLRPASIDRLIGRIETTPNSLDFVASFQGTGKSVAASYLKWLSEDEESKLGRVVYVKLKEAGDLTHQIVQNLLADEDYDLRGDVYEAIFQSLRDYAAAHPSFSKKLSDVMGDNTDISEDEYWAIHAIVGRRSYDRERWGDPKLESALSLMSRRGRDELEEKVVMRVIASPLDPPNSANVLVFDCPDYRKDDARTALGDMDALSELWQRLTAEGWRGHFVVFLQKELNLRHFFLGKGEHIELGRFKPEELVKFFHDRFSGRVPFTDEALSQLANFSDGNFRRFKKYVGRALDWWRGDPSRNRAAAIEISVVKEAVTPQDILTDMEGEMGRLLPNPEQARNAIQTLAFVMRNDGKVNQKSIAEGIGLSQDIAGRLLRTLHDGGYVCRTRTSAGIMISLA